METTEERLATGKSDLPSIFSIYINDNPIHDGTRTFMYADDLCIIAQYPPSYR